MPKSTVIYEILPTWQSISVTPLLLSQRAQPAMRPLSCLTIFPEVFYDPTNHQIATRYGSYPPSLFFSAPTNLSLQSRPIFKAPVARASLLGLDKLAQQKREAEAAKAEHTPKKVKLDSTADEDEDDQVDEFESGM